MLGGAGFLKYKVLLIAQVLVDMCKWLCGASWKGSREQGKDSYSMTSQLKPC